MGSVCVCEGKVRVLVEGIFRSPENGHTSEVESKVKEKVRIMEEFLHLLITIIGERHEPGVGQVTRDQKLAREVIHQLCISPMAHSELVRGLQDSGQLELVCIAWRLQEISMEFVVGFGRSGKYFKGSGGF